MNRVTRIRKRFFGASLLSTLVLLSLSAAPAEGGRVEYAYDDSGRLNSTIYVDEKIRGYTLDAAGNRTILQDKDAPLHAGVPSGPATSLTGNYTVTWTASASALTTPPPPTLFYKLYESHDLNSSDETFVDRFTTPSASINGRRNGTYYYRVRTCFGETLCGWAIGPGTATTVTIPPGAPNSITLPPTPNTTGNYSISWTAPAYAQNATLATSYELYESSAQDFSNQMLVSNPTRQSPASITGKLSGTYYYRVRACDGSNCGAYTTGTYGVRVIAGPPTPTINVLPTSTGTITVSWSTTGPVTNYQLYESVGNTNFSSINPIYSGTAASYTFARDDGQYYYRVFACNNDGCTPSAIAGPVAVVNPPPPPLTVTVPQTNNTGNYRVTWSTPNGGVWSGPELYYEIYEAGTDGVFGATAKYTGGNNYYDATNYPEGTYSYRVRSCNVSGCGNAYRDGDHSVQVILPPAAPASISVPPTSSGSYNVSWDSVSTATSYTLFQSSASNFANQYVVYQGSGTVAPITNGTGTFYHRVQACKGIVCSGYTAASQGVVVTLPPSAPPSINASTTQSSGDYTITWGASTSGTVTKYELYESVSDPNFTNQVNVTSAVVTSWPWTGRSDGTYYYRVRACNGASCSGYATLSSAVVVARPPGMPAWIDFSPSQTSVTGNYTISWGAPTSGTVTRYELRESTSSTPWSVIYNDSGLRYPVTNHASGHFLYQVAACNQFACGQPQGNPAVDVSFASPPTSVSVPSTSTSGNYSVSWSGASGTITYYEVYEATNPSFSGETRVYSGGSTPAPLTGKGNNTYYYHVRACNSLGCTGMSPSSNPITVSIAPGPPSAPSITSPPNGSYTSPITFTVKWTSSSGATNYELYETNTDVTTTATLVYSGATPSTTRAKGRGTWVWTVRACNASGCGAMSQPKTVSVCGSSNGC